MDSLIKTSKRDQEKVVDVLQQNVKVRNWQQW